MWLDIVISAVVAGLVEAFLHYFPWMLALRRPIPRVMAYVFGVFGLAIPYSVMLVLWITHGSGSLLGALIGFWVVCIVGGGAVAGAYLLDGVLIKIARSEELGELYEAKREIE